ncbi:hypothetical protein CK203_063788 [Vitis vinifera]|uniref:Transposon Ty3-I Gag-Pol polyprotein n=1 Tax=Vitis vinifera TaxID=29760 RepID=A0A438G878_VITVI|nr:hypothetical protein CK203_063788 [Vitis vinifera]
MDLFCAYHQGSGHETDHFHTSHAIPPPAGGIHFMDFTKPDDCIHMLNWDDFEPEPIVVDESYEVLRIPTSFNLLLGRLWIHRARAIPSSLHQKVKFIHEGKVITIYYAGDTYSTSKPVLEISHGNDDLFLTGFTFDEIQTKEVEQFSRDHVVLPFDEHGSTVVLDMMRFMSFLPGLGLRRCQHGSTEFIAAVDHDTPFGLCFVPTDVDYRYMTLLCNERLRDHLLHMPFDYPIRPYRISLADYFVRAPEAQMHSERITSGLSVDQETKLQYLVRQLQLSDGASSTSTSVCKIDGVIRHDEYNDEMLAVDMSQITDDVQPETVSPLDLFRVKEEIQKQLSVGFLSVVEYLEWLANVVHVPKKDGNVIFCVDFRDLNKASPKDDFPLPHINMLVDSTTSHLVLSFMDRMMSFGLKNVRVTYQIAATTLFHDMMHQDVEFRLRLNPKKCTFRVTSGKLLGYMFLVPPTPGRLLLLYLSVSDIALGCMLAQLDDLGKPALIGRLMRWLVLLTKFDIHYVTQKSIRWSIVADHLASLPISDGRVIDNDFQNEDITTVTSFSGWHMYFDGAANHSGYGIDRTSADRVMKSMQESVDHIMGGHMLALWGIDIIGKISLKSSNGHESILVAIDYFTKDGFMRVALEQQISEADWAQAGLDQLNLLDERRLRATDHVIRELIRDPRGKFRPNWSRPYFIRELTLESAAWLMDLDGNRFSEPINVDQLKKCYVKTMVADGWPSFWLAIYLVIPF